ncbi:MAG: SLC13 family permease [Anaerolineae bacterium]
MTTQVVLLLSILVIGVAIFVSERLRPDLTALLILLALGVTGLVTPQQAFSGFSNSSVILLLAVFIMTGALFHTGVSSVIGHALVRAAGRSEVRLIALVTLTAAGLSLLMNNIASAAVLMPAVMDAARRTKISPSRVLLPMAFATQLGGMATLFTTSNLVASGVLHNAGLTGFGVFDFIPVGGLAALAGLAYLIVFGRRALPDRRPVDDLRQHEKTRDDLLNLYQIQERVYEVHLKPQSSLIGQALKDTGIGQQLGVTVVAIERRDRYLFAPNVSEVIRKDDVLLVEGREEWACKLIEWGAIVEPVAKWPNGLTTDQIDLLEVIVAPRSRLIGQTLKQIQFRTKYGLNVVALWRGDRSYRTAFSDFELQGGEALLVHGPRENFKRLQDDPDWIVLQLAERVPTRRRKMPLTLLILAAALLASAVSAWPAGFVLMMGAVAMILTGGLSMDEAYQAIDWRSVFLVAGMLPVGLALTNTGAAQLLGSAIAQATVGLGPMGIAAGLFLVTTLFNQFIPGGSAVPAVLVPIAIEAAHYVGADPRAFAMVVAIATGTSMLTPFAHPVNVLVMGPGGYHFRDFLRIGLPVVIIVFVVVMIALPLFWRIGG